MTLRVKVSKKHQIAVPAEVRRELNIQSGDYLTVEVRDGSIHLKRDLDEILKRLSDLNKVVYVGVNVDQYIDQERESWSE